MDKNNQPFNSASGATPPPISPEPEPNPFAPEQPKVSTMPVAPITPTAPQPVDPIATSNIESQQSAISAQPAKKNKMIWVLVLGILFGMAVTGVIVIVSKSAEENKEKQAFRDTQRKEDISRFMTAVTYYQANNRGAIPDFTDSKLNPSGACEINSSGELAHASSFCGSYVVVEANNEFFDPDGTVYNIVAANEPSAGFPTTVDFPLILEDEQIRLANDLDYDEYGHKLHVVYNATCQKEVAVVTAGQRKFAVLYKLENGGAICQSN
ncbi:MAG: hypothetical protein LBE03_00805 [Candidatus Nomurabacteria bacterium]|jgi:hypothetical protein|nr:hypothetical protein [Candidatus Nomurabacteria bacterium]